MGGTFGRKLAAAPATTKKTGYGIPTRLDNVRLTTITTAIAKAIPTSQLFIGTIDFGVFGETEREPGDSHPLTMPIHAADSIEG